MTTYHKQTAKLISVVAENMPELPDEVMQGWIENPKAVRKILSAFAPPESTERQVPPSALLPSLTSRDLTGGQAASELESEGFRVSDCAKDVMSKPAFTSTTGVTYQPVLIKGEEFSDAKRTTKNIRAEAARRGYLTPPAELAPLLRKNFSDDQIEALGLVWLVVMHEPITDSDGRPNLLGALRRDGGPWFDARYGRPVRRWARAAGFVFLAPQVSPVA